MLHLKKIFAAAVLLVSVAFTPLWTELARIYGMLDISYEQRKTEFAYSKFPIDGLAARLDELLPANEPLALSGALKANEFLRQRLSEGLYPRRIDSGARYVLGAEHGGPVTLSGVSNGPLEPKPPRAEFFSWPVFIALVLSISGLGIAVIRMAHVNLVSSEQVVGASIVCGAIVVALTSTLATWTQVPIPALAPVLLGAACFLGFVPRKKPNFFGVLRWLRRAENLVFVAVAFLFFIKVHEFPISLWDGRSIWLFRAKEISHHFMFARADILNPDYAWAHPEYPLLLPAWLAYFNALSGSIFSERMAAMGIPVLASALFLLIRPLAGGVATAAVFLGVQHLFCGAYADGLVLLLLMLEFLAEDGFLVSIAALGASLAKFEGLVFAAIVALIAKKKPRFFLVFVPAILHVLWGKALGLKGDFSDIQWTAVAGSIFERLTVIVSTVPELLGRSSLLAPGLAAGVLVVPLLFTQYKTGVNRERACRGLLSGVCFLVVILILFIITPRELGWHLRTAMDRLLLHPAGFFIMAIL